MARQFKQDAIALTVSRLAEQARGPPVDEFGLAITALECARNLKQRARLSSKSIELIAELAGTLRDVGESQKSPFLLGIAEALDDWLIWA